jgi:hypothetical protein
MNTVLITIMNNINEYLSDYSWFTILDKYRI